MGSYESEIATSSSSGPNSDSDCDSDCGFQMDGTIYCLVSPVT